MIPSLKFTKEAETAAERYDQVLNAWRLDFAQVLSGGNFTTGKQSRFLIAHTGQIAAAYLAHEEAVIAKLMFQIALEAQATTERELAVTVTEELSDAADAHLQDAQTYLLEQIAHQLERDIEFLQMSLRRAVLQVQLSANARRIPIRQAQMEYQRSNPGSLQFSFQDRGNNKWSSKVYIRTTFRHNLLSLYNEVVLLTLADHGIDTAEISHTDPKSEFNGMKISAVPGTKIPTYSEIRDRAFHPNSNAIVIYGGA